MDLKIHCYYRHFLPKVSKQTLKTMKLIAIILFAACFQVSARGYSQITLFETNAPLQKVFHEIQLQSGYDFVSTYETMKEAGNVTVNVENVSLQKALDECLKEKPLTYVIIGKTIVIHLKEKVHYNTRNNAIVPEPLPPPSIEIHGRVMNQKGEPLPNASVLIAGTKIGTTTDINGRFTLNVIKDKNIVLEISSIGYQMKKVSVKKETEINIILELEVTGLSDVVVMGYGTQQKKDITGAVSVISSKDIADRSNTDFGYSIEGKTAGVQVLRSSGQPQAGFSIRIRGTSTITAGSEPLYIIDGVPTTSTNEINPSDIESITVLKDASSAAIYGASGANGVVLITTKRGKNQKTQVSAGIYTGVSNAWKKVGVLNGTQYIDLMTEMGLSPASGWDSYSKVNTNWQDLVFRTGHSQNYNLSAAGGNANTQFYVSGSLLEQKGIIINNSLERANFKLNIDHKINKIFKIGSSISYDKWSDVDVSENSKNGVIFGLITGVPVIKPMNPDGTYASNPLIADIENPVASAYASDHKWTNSRFNGNTYIEALVLNGLKLRTMLGYEQTNGAYNAFVNPIQSKEGRTWNGIADQSLEQTRYWISENTITYDKDFRDNKFTILGGFITSDTKSNSLSEHATGFGGSAVTTVNGGAVHTLEGADISERSNVSFLSRINYSYADKYLLTANFRSDASSVFGPKNRWGYFPSFSAGWRISREDFFKSVTAINDLKLRVGWGQVGNDQIAAYSYLGLVDPSSNYVFDDAAVSGTAPITLENPELRWETTDQLNIGMDISFWKSRVTLTSDYYIKRTKDLLLNVPIPASVGIPSNSALQNAGKIENRGIEFQLNTKNLINKFRWSTGFNISFNQNKVLDMVGTSIKVGSIESRGNTSIAQEGFPLGTFWGYIYEGVDPNTGNAIYKDLDKNGDIDEDDKTIIGKANPKYTFGLTNSFNYKGFSIDVFFQGVQGNQIFNATRVLSEAMIDGKSQSAAVLKRWTKPGQITNIPRQSLNDPGIPDPTYNSLISSRYIEDGSYVRLKSLTIGYTLPKAIINKLGINRCLIYITGENLLTFTNYSGFDPEVSAFGASNTAPGVDFGTYPQSRDILFGLNISF
ncbi:MAG: TonB-dependent receptor [Ginsengibacter sp.]